MKVSLLLFAVPELASAFLLPQSYAPSQVHARELLGSNYDTSFEFFAREADAYGDLFDLYARDDFLEPEFDGYLYRRGVDKGKGRAVNPEPPTAPHDDHHAPPSSLTPPAPAHQWAKHAGSGGEEYELRPISQASSMAPSYHSTDPRRGQLPQVPLPVYSPANGNPGASAGPSTSPQVAQQSTAKVTQKAWGILRTATQAIFKFRKRKTQPSKAGSAGPSTQPITNGYHPGAVGGGESSASAGSSKDEDEEVWEIVSRACTLDPEDEKNFETMPDGREGWSHNGEVPITERAKQVCEGMKNPDTRHDTIDGVLQFVQGACMAGAGYGAATGQAPVVGGATIGAATVVGLRGINDACHSYNQAVQEGAAQRETAPSRPRRVRQRRDLELAYLNYALFLQDI